MSQVGRAPSENLGAGLTERDRRILRDIWLYRYLRTPQITRLHFGSQKLAQRRMRRLVDSGVVERFRADDAVRAGFRTWCFRLSRKGARVVASDEGLPSRGVIPSSRAPRRMRFLDHHSMTVDFRIWLREGCEDSRGRFGYRFIPSYEEVREKGMRRRRVVFDIPRLKSHLVPDGVFVLETSDKRSSLFVLEIDRGTEPLTGSHPSAIERKLLLYRVGYESNSDAAYERLFGVKFSGFRVLCLVPDSHRADGFLKLARRCDLQPLVWVGLDQVVRERGDLSKKWWQTEEDGSLRSLME